MLFSRFKLHRCPTWIFFVAVFASAPGPAPSVLAGGLSEKSSVTEVYKLRVEDRLLAQRTLEDLVELLGGTSRSTIIKGSRPKTLRLDVILPQDQSAYFLSKLSGLGELTLPSPGPNQEEAPESGSTRKISIDVFDR